MLLDPIQGSNRVTVLTHITKCFGSIVSIMAVVIQEGSCYWSNHWPPGQASGIDWTRGGHCVALWEFFNELPTASQRKGNSKASGLGDGLVLFHWNHIHCRVPCRYNCIIPIDSQAEVGNCTNSIGRWKGLMWFNFVQLLWSYVGKYDNQNIENFESLVHSVMGWPFGGNLVVSKLSKTLLASTCCFGVFWHQ